LKNGIASMAVGNRGVQGKNINDQLAFRKGGLANLRLLDGAVEQFAAVQLGAVCQFAACDCAVSKNGTADVAGFENLTFKDAAIYARANSERFVIIDLTGWQ
jgi:hypothetical protein